MNLVSQALLPPDPVRATVGVVPADPFTSGFGPPHALNLVSGRQAPTADGPLTALIGDIIARHHASARFELDRLTGLTASLGPPDTSLPGVARAIDSLAVLKDELRAHMTKEEVVIFPYIASLERALRVGRRPVRSPFSALERPLRAVLAEQGATESLLASIRQASSGYTAPAGASPALQGLYDALGALESALEEHGRIEMELLFPRALALELQVLQ